MSVIERVAESQAKYDGRSLIGMPRSERNRYMERARAAIEAMREPTEAMQRAIPPQDYTIQHYYGTGHHATFPTLGSGPLQIWHSMIDQALSEEG